MLSRNPYNIGYNQRTVCNLRSILIKPHQNRPFSSTTLRLQSSGGIDVTDSCGKVGREDLAGFRPKGLSDIKIDTFLDIKLELDIITIITDKVR